MNDTIGEERHFVGGSPLLRNSPTRKIDNTSNNNTTSTSSQHHPYLTHRTSNTSQSSLSSHGSGGGGKIRSRSSSNSKLNAAGHGGLTNKRKKTSKNQLLAHCLTVPELSYSARHGIRRSSRNRLRDELSRDNVPSSAVQQSSRRRSNRLLGT